MYGIILAGGSGSRLWPLSRELYPKQLLNLNSDKSLLQSTFERLNSFLPADKILSVTNTKHASNVKMQVDKKSIVLSEPISKNTAPAIAISVKYLMQKTNSDPIVVVMPSDLLIEDCAKFTEAVNMAVLKAQQGMIVTFGVKPLYPETGFGYIKIDDNGKVLNFVEKPDRVFAEKYLEEGNYYWNSGIFMFKTSVILDELKKWAPDIVDVIDSIDFTSSDNVPFTEFEKMPNISIDYAVMEKSDRIGFVELKSDWKDLGSWESIYDVSKKDSNGNVFVGHVLDKDSKNSLVYASSKLVATIGLEDTVIVETEDAILACKKECAQEVKEVYETLKQQHDDTQMVHKTVYRPWGFYTVIAAGKGFQTKIIHVNPGQKLSVQSHDHRSEHWVVLSGTAKVVLESKDYILSPGHSIDIPVKAIHSLQNPFNEDVEIIEVQKGDILSEDDIIRYEDMYGRA